MSLYSLSSYPQTRLLWDVNHDHTYARPDPLPCPCPNPPAQSKGKKAVRKPRIPKAPLTMTKEEPVVVGEPILFCQLPPSPPSPQIQIQHPQESEIDEMVPESLLDSPVLFSRGSPPPPPRPAPASTLDLSPSPDTSLDCYLSPIGSLNLSLSPDSNSMDPMWAVDFNDEDIPSPKMPKLDFVTPSPPPRFLMFDPGTLSAITEPGIVVHRPIPEAKVKVVESTGRTVFTRITVHSRTSDYSSDKDGIKISLPLEEFGDSKTIVVAYPKELQAGTQKIYIPQGLTVFADTGHRVVFYKALVPVKVKVNPTIQRENKNGKGKSTGPSKKCKRKLELY